MDGWPCAMIKWVAWVTERGKIGLELAKICALVEFEGLHISSGKHHFYYLVVDSFIGTVWDSHSSSTLIQSRNTLEYFRPRSLHCQHSPTAKRRIPSLKFPDDTQVL
jgi:hypothetical protein